MTDEELRDLLLHDFLFFVQRFFEYHTKRAFILSQPVSNESHFKTLARELVDVFLLKTNRLMINISPGWGKSLLTKMFICWTTAHYPDSNHLYISYSHELASSHTHDIKSIMTLPIYKHLFGVEIPRDSSAKDFFKTTRGGAVAAFGSGGAITGRNSGLPGLDRYSGCTVLDDGHKPDQIHSDTIRENVKRNFFETILPRARGINVPIIIIGQRLHEDDLFASLLRGDDGHEWKHVVIKALDDAGQARYPEVKTREQLLIMKEKQPYVFASQYQQNPIPAGGALYKADYFPLLDKDPTMCATFITADTAETDKDWNDKTVFSFWGVYKVETRGGEVPGLYALHWLDCRQLQIEPKDIEDEFLDFWATCMQYKVKPQMAIIEKKSTGVTLVSVLKKTAGIKVVPIERTVASGSKGQRYIDMQQYIASKLISLPEYGRHTKMCIDHMVKITASGVHRWDDICFVAGTKIATIWGSKNIEDVKIGDKVITPFGIGLISRSCCSGEKVVVEKIGLIGTPDHKVFTDKGFISLDTVCDADGIDKLSFVGLLRWRQRKLLYLMEKNILVETRQDIIAVIKEKKNTSFFTELFGSFIVKQKYQKGMWFITRTIINTTIVMKIWSCYRGANMLKDIKVILMKSVGCLQTGIKAKRGISGIKRTLKPLSISPIISFVQYVKSLTLQIVSPVLFARSHAEQSLEGKGPLPILQHVNIAGNNLLGSIAFQDRDQGKHAPMNADINLQPGVSNKRVVYRLTVDKYGVFYGNDVLLANCDTAHDAVRAALIDKTVVYKMETVHYSNVAKNMAAHTANVDNLRNKSFNNFRKM